MMIELCGYFNIKDVDFVPIRINVVSLLNLLLLVTTLTLYLIISTLDNSY